ncbi:MAG: restriction endonuclease subunit S [Synergistota bacterium]|nr:restriction endonuclease subunit S [Synergistota bacterium]
MIAEQLKKSILQAAIQGKLTQQLPEDGDARDLLKEIQKEKARLIKEGKIKKEKPLPDITEDEIPFEIPENWCWVRLGEIVYNHGQKVPNKEFTYIDISSINNRTNSLGEINNVLKPENAPSRARKIIYKGDVIYATVRPYLQNICVIDKNIEPEPIASTGFAVVCTPMPTLNFYLFKCFLSPMFDSYANDNDNSRGVAYPAINDDKFSKALIPLPPIAEQERIHRRIEELLPEIEALKNDETKLEELQKSFPKKMKDAILQYAIQGKLTQQLPEDGDARDLLKEIKKEKARLVKEGKIKKEKPLPEITEDEIPFEIPENWCWVRLGNLCEYLQRGKSPIYSPIKKYPVIAQKCNQWEGFSIEKAQFIDPASVEKYAEERILKNEDLMWNSTGLGTLGRIAIYEDSKNPYGFAVADSHVTVIRMLKNYVCPLYIFFYLSGPYIQSIVEDISSGSTKQKELLTSTIEKIIVPLPPMEEQKRILSRLKELIPLCEKLSS